jgi:hypothetical protein
MHARRQKAQNPRIHMQEKNKDSNPKSKCMHGDKPRNPKNPHNAKQRQGLKNPPRARALTDIK